MLTAIEIQVAIITLGVSLGAIISYWFMWACLRQREITSKDSSMGDYKEEL